MGFVRIIHIMGCRSIEDLMRAVKQRYPDARIRVGEDLRPLIVVPDLLWNQSPNGPEGFFGGLCRSGVIRGYHHKRYSDWEEVRR